MNSGIGVESLWEATAYWGAMRVLHFFSNIASQMPPTITGLNSLGVKSKAVSFGTDHIQEGNGLVRYINLENARDRYYLMWCILWCNVIHWYYCVNLTDLFPRLRKIFQLMKLLKRTIIFEAWGSDIRNIRIALKDNEFMQRYLESTGHSPASLNSIGTHENSMAVQQSIAFHGGSIMVPHSELIDYVDRDLFPLPYISRVRLNLDLYQPDYRQNDIPVIVHTPTDKGGKGTQFVIEAIESLKNSGVNFKFILIHGVKHGDAMNTLRNADILIDQLIFGDVGVAAREAMALGKIAIGYLTDRVKKIYGAEFPLVLADCHSLKDVLASLLNDPQRMGEIRVKSRQYIEKYHDCRKVALDLLESYKSSRVG